MVEEVVEEELEEVVEEGVEEGASKVEAEKNSHLLELNVSY